MKLTKLLTVNELAKYMKVNRVTVLRWIKDKKINAHRINKRGDWRIKVEEINKILK